MKTIWFYEFIWIHIEYSQNNTLFINELVQRKISICSKSTNWFCLLYPWNSSKYTTNLWKCFTLSPFSVNLFSICLIHSHFLKENENSIDSVKMCVVFEDELVSLKLFYDWIESSISNWNPICNSTQCPFLAVWATISNISSIFAWYSWNTINWRWNRRKEHGLGPGWL